MNPIVIREFFGILRMPRAIATIVVLAAAFALLVLARWPTEGLVDLSGAQSRQVFRVYAYGLLGGILLLAPAVPATSIVRERIKGTLALLLNSPMSASSIYFGKLGGIVLFTAILLLTSLPASAACYAMGGIDLQRDLGALYATLTILAVQCIALGLFVSSYAATPDSAVRLTYGLVLAVCFAPLVPNYLLHGQPGLTSVAAEWLRCVSPIPVIMQLVGHGAAGSQGLMETRSSVIQFVFLSVPLTLVVIGATIRRLNFRLYDRSRSQGKITEEQPLFVRMMRRLVFLVDPQRRKPGIPFFMNPVMVKEFRTRRFGRFHWLLRLISICAVASLLLTLAATTETMDWGVETIGGMLVLLQVFLVVMITPSLAAGLISSERESGGWDLLRVTTISGLRIVTGKLASVAWTLLLVLLATAPGYVVMIYIKPAMWLQVQQVMICLLLTVVYTLTLSAAFGSFFSRTATSTVAVYVMLMALFLGPLLIWLGREAPFGQGVVEAALAINPMGAALSVIAMPGFAQYDLIPISWWIAAGCSFVALIALCVRVWKLMRPL